MTDQEWDELVRRLEPEARENPKRYGRKVAALAALGYAVIVVVLLALAAAAAAVAWIGVAAPVLLFKLGIPILALGALVLRALWVRIDAPDGLPLERADAPELFRVLDEVNAKVEGPKLHRVLIDGALNASVVQQPRPGLIFGQRNYLLLGLPLMQALTPDEFRAVIAHELGHLSRAHGRFAAWIYRIRATWWQLLAALEEKRHWGAGPVRRFFAWYVPYFNAYTFPLMRAHEFEADRAAAEVAGPRPAASALAALPVAGTYLEGSFWPTVYGRAATENEPPVAAFAPLRAALADARAADDARDCITIELERPSQTTDTHPCLADRLEALGVPSDEVLAETIKRGGPPTTAAEAFLGDAEAELTQALDQAWRESVAPAWRQRYEEAEEGRRTLAELERRSAEEALPVDDARLRAQLTADLHSLDEAVPLYREVLEQAPDDAPSNYALGCILLGRDDDTGLVHLDRAIDHDPEAVLPACEAAIGYLEEHRRHDETERYRSRARARLDELERAEAVRANVDLSGEMVPHDLPPEAVEAVREQLARCRGIKRAYLLRKVTGQLDDEWPLYVLYVLPRRTLLHPFGGDRDKVVDKVDEAIELPFQYWIASPGSLSFRANAQLRKNPKSEIYRS